MEEGNINTKDYWNINYSQGFYQDNSKSEWAINHEFLMKALPKRSCRILEVACGLAHNAKFAAELGHKVIATDFSEVAIKESAKRFKHDNIRYDCLSIQEATSIYRDNDVIMAFEIIEHFKMPLIPLLQINKALASGGIFIFTVPTATGRYGEWHQHYVLLNYEYMTKLLFRANFKEVRFLKMMFEDQRIYGVTVK
jgi:2-polyprenyl-3-methyl-5-hydroxy-6-metoxy-1,4-benzoquinol methylase